MKWKPTVELLPGESHGQTRLVGSGSWRHRELDVTEVTSHRAHSHFRGLPRWCGVKESICQCKTQKRSRLDLWVGKTPWSRKWQPTPIFLPRKFHEQRRLVGYCPRGCKESDATEWLNMHVHIQSLSKNCIYSYPSLFPYTEMKRNDDFICRSLDLSFKLKASWTNNGHIQLFMQKEGSNLF